MKIPSRRIIPALLAAATLIPIVALGWLTVRILQQESAIAAQHLSDGARYSAGRLALAIEARLAGIEEQLSHGQGIIFRTEGIETRGDSLLLYRPAGARAPALPDAAFTPAETLEFQRQDLPAAAREYRRLADSGDPPLRAAALVRLGAVLRKQHDSTAAIEVYTRLQSLGAATVESQPAEWIARQGRCRIYEEAGNRDRLRNEAAALARAVYSGASPVERATFELYSELLRNWGASPPPSADVARTEAVISLWSAWRGGELPARGRRMLTANGTSVLAIWTGSVDRAAAWLAPPDTLENTLAPSWKSQGLRAALYDPNGERLLGPDLADSISLAPGDTHLPFVLRIAIPADSATSGYGGLLLTGILLTFVLMTAAAYGLYRAVAREMALAQQQAEFVSTVSHEFRTPLTSMRHLTELLATGSVPSEERKATYYQLLARETERLHHMVESLLSFGRMQAGAYAWRLELADPSRLVQDAVEEFRHEPNTGTHQIVCETDDDLPPIQADREALSRALSNLLENAEKYSDAGSPIRVRARKAGRAVRISVEDHGAGIPPEEQKQLFRKFIRGSQAQRAGIRGIGVGLALVKSVAEAHGGSVELASEPGRGSTFTLVIPCPES